MTALPRTYEHNDAVVDAINGLSQAELDAHDGWQPLADLSSHTAFEMIDADPDSIVMGHDARFEAIATVYVTLIYGSGKDEERMSDEYTATVRGAMVGETVSIETINVDTTPFYS